jgi:hypothetical protein
MPKSSMKKTKINTIACYFGSDSLLLQNRKILPNDQTSFGQNIRLFLKSGLGKQRL